MTRRERRNTGASVRARLLNRSRSTGEDFQFLLQRYAAERFLYRLGESQHRERYVLKGAMLLVLWGEAVYRPTRDLDLAGYGSSLTDDVHSALCDICEIEVADDGVVFESGDIEIRPIREHDEFDGLRAIFRATLAGARIRMQIDIGFGNAIQPPPINAHYPTLLDAFPPQIRVYSRIAVVAEKFHAMVENGERNSRYKDFYDLHALVRHFDFDGDSLVRAIGATFEKRRTAISRDLPVALTPRFYDDDDRAGQWRTYLERNKLPRAPSDFSIVGERILSFLREPWDAMARDSEFTGSWSEGGPWQHGVGR